MRTMMKDVPKDLNKLTSIRRMALCKSYSAIGNMAAQLKSCTSAELKAGLANANRLCGAKKPVSTKKPGSGSGAKKPMTTKKATPSKMCAEASQMVGVFYAYVCDYVYVRVRVRAREESQQQQYAPA